MKKILIIVTTIMLIVPQSTYALRPQSTNGMPMLRLEGSKASLKGNVEILVQSTLGELCGYSDEEYSKAGAEVVNTAKEVWDRANIVLKVKEPLNEGDVDEFELMFEMKAQVDGPLIIGVVKEIKADEGRAALLPDGVVELLEFAALHPYSAGDIIKFLSTYIHHASSYETTKGVLDSNVNTLTLEAIEGDPAEAALFQNPEWLTTPATDQKKGEQGRIVVPRIVKEYKEMLFKRRGQKTLPCLDPMSIVAGIEAINQAVIYTDEGKARIESNRVIIDDPDWIGLNLDAYPDCADMNALDGKITLITGAGTAGLSSLWQAMRLGSKVIISDVEHNLPFLYEILSQEYGDESVAFCNGDTGSLDLALNERRIIIVDEKYKPVIETAFINSDIIIGAALIPKKRAPRTVEEKTIRLLKDRKRRFIADIAVDQGYNIPFIGSDGVYVEDPEFTYHHDPVKVGYNNIIYYHVANMPGRAGIISRASSKMLQAARLPFLKALIQHGLLEAVNLDVGLKAGISASMGKLTDPQVAQTPTFDFDFVKIDDALATYTASLPPAQNIEPGNPGPFKSMPMRSNPVQLEQSSTSLFASAA